MGDNLNEKEVVARFALTLIGDAEVIGLGSGTTMMAFLDAVRCWEGRKGKTFIPSSEEIARKAREIGLKIADLEEFEYADITIDGADEIDRDLNLLKGGGGFLTREKILAASSRRYVIIADHTKLVEKLCSRKPLPVEVIRFGSSSTLRRIMERTGWVCRIREAGSSRYITDNGNYIIDLFPDRPLEKPHEVLRMIKEIPGVVEVGLFLSMADEAYVAFGDKVKGIRRGGGPQPGGNAVLIHQEKG